MVHQQTLESQTLSTPDANEAWMDTLFEKHPGKICLGTHRFDVFLLAPSKVNEAEDLGCGPCPYCSPGSCLHDLVVGERLAASPLHFRGSRVSTSSCKGSKHQVGPVLSLLCLNSYPALFVFEIHHVFSSSHCYALHSLADEPF